VPLPTTIGFLYPGFSAEDDYPAAERLMGGSVRLIVQHTELREGDGHTVEAMKAAGDPRALAAGIGKLLRRPETERPQALAWACTSGSFTYGWEGARKQVAELSTAAGMPATSTSLAFVSAARHLGVERVAVAATYPPSLADAFGGFLAGAGLEVLHLGSGHKATATDAGQMLLAEVVRFALANDHPEAQAVLLPDTAMHTVGCLTELEAELGKPVLTANQVTIWEALRLVPETSALRIGYMNMGALFAA
jgi:maleate cis-trans isomerase